VLVGLGVVLLKSFSLPRCRRVRTLRYWSTTIIKAIAHKILPTLITTLAATLRELLEADGWGVGDAVDVGALEDSDKVEDTVDTSELEDSDKAEDTVNTFAVLTPVDSDGTVVERVAPSPNVCGAAWLSDVILNTGVFSHVSPA
jgi:hypothetical protein